MSPWTDGTPTPREDAFWAWFAVIFLFVGSIISFGAIGLFLIAEFSR